MPIGVSELSGKPALVTKPSTMAAEWESFRERAAGEREDGEGHEHAADPEPGSGDALPRRSFRWLLSSSCRHLFRL